MAVCDRNTEVQQVMKDVSSSGDLIQVMNLMTFIVAPIHLLPQRRDNPLGPPRVGVWGMNTSTITTPTSFTPLETVLLFRGIGEHGFEAPAFSQIATALQTNNLLKNEPTYDVRRLTPESLKDLFLHLLWEELKSEQDPSTGRDGSLSPTSKRRKLEALPLPTLDDARGHLDKIELAYAKSYEAYIRHAIDEIRSLERKFDHAQAELDDIERPAGDEEHEVKAEPVHRHLNGLHDASTLPNGVGPSPKTSPKPSPRMPQLPTHPSPFSQPSQVQVPQHHYQQQQQQQQQQQIHQVQQAAQQTPQPQLPTQAPQAQQLHQAQQQHQAQQVQQGQQQQQQQQLQQPHQIQQSLQRPQPQQQRPNQQPQQPRQQVPQQPSQVVQPHQPLRPLQPSLPHLAPRQDVRNGPGALPAQQAPVASAPRLPGLNHPQITRSPQLTQQDVSRGPIARPQDQPKASSGSPQVLQAPPGVPSFQPLPQSPIPVSEGLQRPDGVGARQSPISAQGGLQVLNQGQLKWEPPYQPSANGPRPPANVLQQQHGPNVFSTPQHMLSAQRPPQIPSPMQAQPGRHAQQIPLPPHTASQFAPPLQTPPPVRPTVETGGAQVANRQQPAVSSPGPTRQQLSVSSPGSSNNPQSPFHPGPYHSYPLPGSAHPPPPPPPPIQTTQAAQPPIHQTPSRTPAVSSPTIPPATATARPAQGLIAPSHQRPIPSNLQNLPPYSQPPLPSGIPSPMQADGSRPYNSPYQPPRTAAVERIHPRLPVTTTPAPAARFSRPPSAPQTPATGGILKPFSAKITKWKEASTPSTPRPGVELRLGWDEVPSPAIEPLSPVLQPKFFPSAPPEQSKKTQHPVGDAVETPASKRKAGRPRTQQSTQEDRSPSTQKSQPADEPPSQPASEQETPRIKDEEVTTPRPTTEIADTVDESTAARHRRSRSTKRKRDDMSPSPSHDTKAHAADAPREGSAAPAAPNVVLWTRSFNKVSGSAMEQIVHHRSANMFAQPIREKDAPGYHKVILHPQDLKSIRAAINHGNRAAAQEAAALPAGDPGTSSWLPRTEELVPPKSIINSGQLDRELAHMFSNAIMYNPDPYHGPGPAFLREANEDGEGQDGGAHQENVLGYKVDEFGVVKDARAMFVEVEKLLSELRSAEKMTAPPNHGLGGTGTGTAAASAAGTRQGSLAQEDHEEQDEQTATETENGDGRSKRRRVARTAA
ncbi:hypothetical protein QBC44DRAFT_380359 [Cladorrhinum sp. PSN332]|nr:hypothetical protein QBC44DRAFT_380359 [Cladorrhinum sp. PSN332]